jgi:serine/threonine-protein kinase HipA
MARVKQLGVWLGDKKVAVLRRTTPGGVSCEYTRQTVADHPLGIPLLSCSLPVRRGRHAAWPFVDGLLPEGHHRASMSRLAGVDSLDALGMLARFGRDVAGALVIALESGEVADAEDTGHVGLPQGLVALGVEDLLAEVARLPARTLALHDDSALSLAGLEDKILLVRTPDGWARPVHGYPSTHILKVDNRIHHGTVVMEHDCLQLARRAGIPAADTQLIKVGDADCIIVERYDRTIVDGSVLRVHQEDACQALGIDPAARGEGRAKYEAEGGPTLIQIARLLTAYATEPDVELIRLLEQITFTVVIGDADAHGKNLSVLHPTPEHIALAPRYDSVPTALWPQLRPTAAMRVNGCQRLAEVTTSDLVTEARRWGLEPRLATAIVDDGCERLRAAAAQLPQRGRLDLASLVTANLDRLAAERSGIRMVRG